MVWAAAIAPEPIASFRPAYGSENRMIPEVRACSGYLVITAQQAYRDNAGALAQDHVQRLARYAP